MMQKTRTILIATGQSIPAWTWELETILRIHPVLSIRELAELVDKPEQRVSEAVVKLADAGRLRRWKVGKERRVALAP
jgi:predicted transcriptional regulator